LRSFALSAGTLAFLVILMMGPALAVANEEYLEVVRTIRCDCGCHPQSIESCACGRAEELRGTIRAQVMGKGGAPPMTAQEIIAGYVAEHGEQIRISPAATGFNLFAWLGPLIALGLGLISTVAMVRHLARNRAALAGDNLTAAAGMESVPAVSIDDPYRERLQQQLRDLD